MNNKYEVMFIINPELGEDGIKAVSDKFKSMLESAGTVEAFAEWGKRRLAYPIQDLTEGYYVLMTFECDVNLITEIKRVAGITDGIMRRLITKA